MGLGAGIMGGQVEGARTGPSQAVGTELSSLRPLRTWSSPGRTSRAPSPPALSPGPRARLRTVSLFTLKVIGSGLFIQISLQKCGNGDIFSICFPENKTKCKRPRREPRTFLGSPMSRSPLPLHSRVPGPFHALVEGMGLQPEAGLCLCF